MTRPPGRPRTRWGDSKLAALEQALADGASFEAAAAALGISSKTLQRHRRDDERVAAAIDAGLAAQQPRPVRHGTPGAYNRGCRCDDCRAAHNARCSAYQRAARRRTRETPAA